MAKKSPPETESILDLPVSFGNISIGDKTARVGLSVPRWDLPIGKADKHFCGKRLSGRIVAKPQGDHPDQ